MHRLLYSLLFIASLTCHSSSLFLPDSDTAALIGILSNSASTVSNTLKILEVAKTTSQKMDEYNALAMRRYYIARRIERHALNIKETKNMKTKNLGEFNQRLLILKTNLKDLRSSIEVIAENIVKSDHQSEKMKFNKLKSKSLENSLYNQELNSASSNTNSISNQNTAINTATTNSILNQMRIDNLEINKTNLDFKRSEDLERLKLRANLKKWLGVDHD